MFSFQSLPQVTNAREALPGRDTPSFPAPTHHEVLDVAATDTWPEGTRTMYVGMGCFWGAERIFWELPGVVTTAVGYMGGYTPNPEYFEVCTGQTGHTEAVLIAYDPKRISTEEILRAFWENHDSTTLNRQGNDVGSQYRSAIYWTTDEQRTTIEISRRAYQDALTAAGHGTITTEVRPAEDAEAADGSEQTAGPFYFAEQDHQQYLELRPWGYCNHGFNGVACQTGLTTAS